MAGRGRHIRGARWSAIGILIAAATAAPQVARADALPAAPSALAQAGLAAAQNAVDTAAAAVSAAQPAVAVPAVPAVAQAAVPTTSAQAAAVSPSAAAQPAAPPAAALAGAVSVIPRPKSCAMIRMSRQFRLPIGERTSLGSPAHTGSMYASALLTASGSPETS